MQTGCTFVVLLGLTALATCQIFKIYDGIDVAPHQFPFLAALFASDKIACTGSIIHANYILSAAHCIIPGLTHITIGNTEASQGLRYDIKDIYIHPGYIGPPQFENDIALIELASPIYADTGVSGIHLPKSFPEGQLLVTGFGFKPLAFKQNTEYLPNTQLQVTDFHQNPPSKAQYAELHRDFLKAEFDKKCNVNPQIQFCYSELNQGITQGDSGGPLVIYDDEDYHQIGISSCNKYLYAGNGDVDVISVFTRISAYCDWMEEVTNGNIYCNDKQT